MQQARFQVSLQLRHTDERNEGVCELTLFVRRMLELARMFSSLYWVYINLLVGHFGTASVRVLSKYRPRTYCQIRDVSIVKILKVVA